MNKQQKESILAFMRLALYQLHPNFNIAKEPYKRMLAIYYDDADRLDEFSIAERQALFMYLAMKGLEEA